MSMFMKDSTKEAQAGQLETFYPLVGMDLLYGKGAAHAGCLEAG